MSVLLYFLGGLLYLVAVLFDVVIFFLVVRALRTRLDHGLVRAVDDAGKSLVSVVGSYVKRLVARCTRRQIAEEKALLLALVMSLLARLAISCCLSGLR